MTPERWEQLHKLFNEIIEAPSQARPELLRKALESLDDSSARAELERLVAHADPEPEFLRPLVRPNRFRPGDLISERFRIVRSLGRGGMGEVFEAHDAKLNERVALKILTLVGPEQEQLLERFQRELRVARQIAHPNVCRVHDMGEHEGTPYITMELVEGETLAERLKRGPLDPEKWLSIADQLLAGLGAAHQAGVVHRDLKPSNLMLSGERLVILDFGLARPVTPEPDGGITQSGALIGSLDWMAPEQLRGESDPRSDLYAAALILLYAVAGSHQSNKPTGLSGAMRRATGKIDFSHLIPRSVPSVWKRVLARCLEAEPEHRPPSVAFVREVLDGKRSLLRYPVQRLAPGRWVGGIAIISIAVALAAVAFRYLQYSGLPSGSLIMLATTDNRTGEDRFSGVGTVLRSSMAQSSEYRIWDNGELGDVLEEMRLEPDTAPTAFQWREIAERRNAPLLCFSTLSPVGGVYSLGLSCEQLGPSPENAVQRWNEEFEAHSAATLFEAIDEAAQWVRSLAGEEASELTAYSRPPEKITSSSWDAIRLFDQAQTLSLAGRAPDAISPLRRAVELDPEFAMGLMRLGDILNAQRRTEGFEYWRRAIDAARNQRLSEREALGIESRYDFEIGDLDRAEPVMRDWMRRFPNDPLAEEFLAATLNGLGRNGEAVEIARDRQERFGRTVFSTSLVISGLAGGNRIDWIEPEIQALESLGETALARRYRAVLAAMAGDYATAEDLVSGTQTWSSAADASLGTALLANIVSNEGDYQRAMAILDEAIAQDREAGEDGLAAQKMVSVAYLEGMLGRREQAGAKAREAITLASSPNVVRAAVAILARNGFPEQARQIMGQYPAGEGPVYEADQQEMLGEVLLAEGDTQPALDLLEQASRVRARHSRAYLARALDLAGDSARAAIIYEDIVNHSWPIWSSTGSESPGTLYEAGAYLTDHQGE